MVNGKGTGPMRATRPCPAALLRLWKVFLPCITFFKRPPGPRHRKSDHRQWWYIGSPSSSFQRWTGTLSRPSITTKSTILIRLSLMGPFLEAHRYRRSLPTSTFQDCRLFNFWLLGNQAGRSPDHRECPIPAISVAAKKRKAVLDHDLGRALSLTVA